MTVNISTSEFRYSVTPAGVMRVGVSRVSLDSVVYAFKQGYSPEEIALDFDALTLGEVYSTINYYLQHKPDVEAYLAKRLVQEESLRSEVEQRFDAQAIRESLLSKVG